MSAAVGEEVGLAPSEAEVAPSEAEVLAPSEAEAEVYTPSEASVVEEEMLRESSLSDDGMKSLHHKSTLVTI